jgi:hypothetical protein
LTLDERMNEQGEEDLEHQGLPTVGARLAPARGPLQAA